MHLHRLAFGAALIAVGSIADPAQAAVTVLGGGAAELCYEAADKGEAPSDGLLQCNVALAGPLSLPDRAATYVNRGVLRLALAEANAAADDFNAGIAINPQIGEAWVDLGAAQVMNKQYADAVASITKGLAFGTKQQQNAYYDRALANEALGNIRAAYDDYRQALVIKPDFAPALTELKRFKVVDKPSGT